MNPTFYLLTTYKFLPSAKNVFQIDFIANFLHFSVADFYNGNLNIPVLNWTPCKADSDQQTSFEEVLSLLQLSPPNKCKIAVEKPVCVKKTLQDYS